jgi:response regulator of citrate/malate metabolism|tara:strand:- start:813 stop:1268 length:456 start_codon:yes stop_codon:yes gene_type:complete
MNPFTLSVLIIEDDKEQAAALYGRLSSINKRFEPVCLFASTIDGAKEIIGSAKIDLILLDLELTDSRRQPICGICRIKSLTDAPIAVITGYPEMKRQVIEEGAIDVMIKPNDVSQTALMSIMYRAIENKRIELPDDKEERHSYTKDVWDSI